MPLGVALAAVPERASAKMVLAEVAAMRTDGSEAVSPWTESRGMTRSLMAMPGSLRPRLNADSGCPEGLANRNRPMRRMLG